MKNHQAFYFFSGFLEVTYCLQFAERGDAAAQNWVGNCYKNGKGVETNAVKAVEWYKKAAEQGHTGAQCNLAFCHENGTGVLKDEKKAVEWYKKAAEQGDTKAQICLANCYMSGTGVSKNKEEAVKWCTEAANRGAALAQYALAAFYENGTGVFKDDKKAVEWYIRAAEQGYAEAQYNLAACYGNGIGVSRDDKKAVEWYTKAAEQGNTDAQICLASCYISGTGVSKNGEEAVKWCTKAANQGDVLAQYVLAVLYENGKGVPKDKKKAVELFAKSAEHGFAKAQYNLANCYKNGMGIVKSKEKAVEWYTKAAEQGNVEAQYNLAVCYKNGMGVAKDKKKAVEWYRKAAEHENADAQYDLAVCYENGTYVSINKEKAAELYKKAVENGNKKAHFSLGMCYEYAIGIKKDYLKAMVHFSWAVKKRVKVKEAYYHIEHLRSIIKNDAEWQQKYENAMMENRKREAELESARSNNYSLEKMIVLLHNMNSHIVDYHEKQLATTKKIESDLMSCFTKIESDIEKINRQLTSLKDYIVHDLNLEIQTARKGLEDLFINKSNEILDQENKIGEFLNEISGKISERARTISPNALSQSEKILKEYFGGAWYKLMPETRTSLKSAYTLWTSCRDIPSHEDFDYSGVVICATAALEYELRKIFFIGFQDYMDTLNLKFEEWPSRLTYINGGELIRSDPKHFSIGSMPYLFGQKSRNERENFDIDLLNEKRNDYLKTIFKEDILQSEYKVKSFSDCITKNIFRNAPIPGQKIKAYHIYEEGSLLYQYEYITNKFRNKAAHAASIDDKAAEECCKMIIGKIEAKEKIENINSVLKQTFELLK